MLSEDVNVTGHNTQGVHFSFKQALCVLLLFVRKDVAYSSSVTVWIPSIPVPVVSSFFFLSNNRKEGKKSDLVGRIGQRRQWQSVVKYVVCSASRGCQGVRVWTAVWEELKTPELTGQTVKKKVLCSGRQTQLDIWCLKIHILASQCCSSALAKTKKLQSCYENLFNLTSDGWLSANKNRPEVSFFTFFF